MWLAACSAGRRVSYRRRLSLLGLSLALTAGLLPGGCLYLGSINSPPYAQIDVIGGESVGNPLIKGTPIQLRATVHDQEDGTDLGPGAWTVTADDFGPSEPNCDFVLTLDADTPGSRNATLALYRAGRWTITFQVTDQQGAQSNMATYSLFVDDAAPSLSPATLMPRDGANNSCWAYRAGEPIVVQFPGTVNDADQAGLPSCPRTAEAITYHWEIVGLPPSSRAAIGPLVGAACPPSPPGGSGPIFESTSLEPAVCLWPDVIPGASASITSNYGVQLWVRDDPMHDWVKSERLSVAVLPDLPPCVSPANAQPAALEQILGQGDSLTLWMPRVDDDLDPYDADHPMSLMQFVWSVHRTGDPTWRVVPNYSLPYYTIDAASFDVGEQVRVRVEARDRTGQAATCDPDQELCTSASACLFGQQCQRWTTWTLDRR
jgi:hypothetical protein